MIDLDKDFIEEWKKPVIAVLVALFLGKIISKILQWLFFKIEYVDGTIWEYLHAVSVMMLTCFSCFVMCVIALTITDSKEKLIVWGFTIYGLFWAFFGGVFISFLSGYYSLPLFALLFLLIPRYSLKYGKNIGTKIMNTMKGLASEIED